MTHRQSLAALVPLTSLASLAFVTACWQDVVVGSNSGPATISKDIAVEEDLDVLFVIDNSASTADKQTVFANGFSRFVAGLDAFPSGRPNLHIGVVSTTVGIGVAPNFGGSCPEVAYNDDGLLHDAATVPGCSPPTGRFISDIKTSQGDRVVNYAGTLPDALACIGQLGTGGCGFEAPLEAMKRALDGSRPENAGFLRPEANLAVVIFTDEDDCSTDPSLFDIASDTTAPGDFRCTQFAYDCDQPMSFTEPASYTNCHVHTGGPLRDPATYAAFLASIKDPSSTSVILVAGDPTPSIQTGAITQPFTQSLALMPTCTAVINGNEAIARPSNRLQDFLAAVGYNTESHTICASDYTSVMDASTARMYDVISSCMPDEIDAADTDPANSGTQPACTVSDRTQVGNTTKDVPMHACTMIDPNTPDNGPRPCWWMEANPTACVESSSALELHIERTSPPVVGTVVHTTCTRAP